MQEKAKQDSDAQLLIEWDWVETAIWTERMLAALGNGVQGGESRMPPSQRLGSSPLRMPGAMLAGPDVGTADWRAAHPLGP